VVTCNYEARRRGLRKLQLIRDAKKICPDVVIVLGEDLTKFRDASKELFSFLRAFLWDGRAEKLGFDEVSREPARHTNKEFEYSQLTPSLCSRKNGLTATYRFSWMSLG
jgi:nucleotidyltransferase/DNA polymerase involved in DNA repair